MSVLIKKNLETKGITVMNGIPACTATSHTRTWVAVDQAHDRCLYMQLKFATTHQ
jgi:hypothetical protein